MIKIASILVEKIRGFYPHLKSKLKKANIKSSPEEFIRRTLRPAIVFSVIISFFFLLIFIKEKVFILLIVPVFVALASLFFMALMKTTEISIKRRKWEVESDLLYSGRYLLIKLESGEPFVNALISVGKITNKSSKYFAEIVSNISLGMTLEDAIENSIQNSPSDMFKKILIQIKDAIKTGSDVTESLKATLKEITQQRMIDIQTYGKQLGPLTMFYMIIGTIMPSIGVVIFVILATFINLKVTLGLLLVMAAFLFVVQYFFILFYKAIRPMVEV